MSNYRYDIHVHTSESSKCGHVPAKEMVEEYKARGYAGIAITDHLHQDFVDRLSIGDNWDACIDALLLGYKEAKKHGDKIGLDVIMSAEIRFSANDNDYLLFGISEDFLRSNPFLFHLELDTFYEKYKDEITIVQAHPFRGGGVGVHPEYLHGIEIINCNERHNNNNPTAIALTEENPHLIRISASDAHRPEDIARASIIAPKRITDSFELQTLLLDGGYQLESPEFSELLEKAGVSERVRA